MNNSITTNSCTYNYLQTIAINGFDGNASLKNAAE